jgi:hypothetical protein
MAGVPRRLQLLLHPLFLRLVLHQVGDGHWALGTGHWAAGVAQLQPTASGQAVLACCSVCVWVGPVCAPGPCVLSFSGWLRIWWRACNGRLYAAEHACTSISRRALTAPESHTDCKANCDATTCPRHPCCLQCDSAQPAVHDHTTITGHQYPITGVPPSHHSLGCFCHCRSDCCPLKDGVTCSDGKHCCPGAAPVCDTASGTCSSEDGKTQLPWADKFKAGLAEPPAVRPAAKQDAGDLPAAA